MCNHYENTEEIKAFAAAMARSWTLNNEGDVVVPDDLPPATGQVYPKMQAPVLIQTEAGRALASMRWGVQMEVQGATKPLTKFVTNARDDKFSGYAWRWMVAERRCLIPAIGYFEPDGPEGGKWEVRFSLKDRPTFFLAGLWSTDADRVTRSFTMVTTGPNELAAKIHDRMPAVLTDDGARAWLGHKPLPPAEIKRLIAPFPAELMDSVALPPPERAKKISKAELKASETQGELLF